MGTSGSKQSEHRVFAIHPQSVATPNNFPRNRIRSHKYTLWSFLPLNLFEQFRRIGNFYFLVIACVALVIESPVSPATSCLPLLFVTTVTACKQGYEDFLRYRSDRRVNRSLVTVIRGKCAREIHCEDIEVGDLVKIHCDEDVPCDLVLLHSTDPSGCCYVTTSNLDGETNLKNLFIPKPISEMSLSEIASMSATMTCQQPLADLYKFHGKIEIEDGSKLVSGHVTVDNLLLRGARLRDTEHVVGCAVYTGEDTKLSLNSKQKAVNKFSTAERSINRYLLVFMTLLALEVILSTIAKHLFEYSAHWSSYLGALRTISLSTIVADALSFLMLYNYIVPISLYVTVELQKFLGSFFFRWDVDMYDADLDQPALANTSDLNEELGQVEYLFTDKTGTLTENSMVFRRCSIGGRTYMERDCDGNLYLLPPSGREEEAEKVTTWTADIWHFMTSLALCHTVHVAPCTSASQRSSMMARRAEFRASFRQRKITVADSSLLMDPSLPEYQASSADEKALVEAAARCGVVFEKGAATEVELRVAESDTYLRFKKLETLEFSSERKRMSVILRDTAGDIWLYCKGADTSIFPLIIEGTVQEAIAHVQDFSMRGLRTLVIGYKKLSPEEFERLVGNVEAARQILGPERSAHLERAFEEMEGRLTLLGVTAVEDRLQDGVQETLESLRAAGIKVWVLTGDKAETAENIAISCGHFKRGTVILRLTSHREVQVCFATLISFERKVRLDPDRQYGLIIDGTSLALVYKKCPVLLKTVAMLCDAVVCCRMSPMQKCEIVHLVKSAKRRPTTAAIGDGGNDVSMIQEAHVGIGITGKEGRQATMSADFAFAKFRYLRKALLVHGHWYYVRISNLIQYFFYKNLVFITPQVFFNFFSGFSTQALYDSAFLMGFNLIFTSAPVLVYGLLERNYSAKDLLQHPHLYQINRRNHLLSNGQFAISSFLAIWHTCVIYWTPYLCWSFNPVILYDNTPGEQSAYSTAIFHMVIFVVNLQILLRSSCWTAPLIMIILLSEAVFFAFAISYSQLQMRYDGDLYMVFHRLAASPTFWLLTVLILVVCFIPHCLILLLRGDGKFIDTWEQQRRREERQREQEPSESDNTSSYRQMTATSVDEERRKRSWFPWRGTFSLQSRM